jgi:hypothetical protein
VTDVTQYTLVKEDAVFRSDLVNTSIYHIRLNHPNLSNVTCHVLEHIGDPNSQHKISIDNVSLIKEIRKPHQLDAYEAIYIMQRKKKNVELMNGDERNVRSRLFDVLF